MIKKWPALSPGAAARHIFISANRILLSQVFLLHQLLYFRASDLSGEPILFDFFLNELQLHNWSALNENGKN